MEYRIHSRNNLIIYFIVIDLSNFNFDNEKISEIDCNGILNDLDVLNINFISIPMEITNLIKNKTTWEEKIGKKLIKSLQVGNLTSIPELINSNSVKTALLSNLF